MLIINIRKKKIKSEKTGKEEEVDTGKIKYPMPAAVFEKTEYWNSDCFYYQTEAKNGSGISATIAAGKSIFWKETKERLCADDSGSDKKENLSPDTVNSELSTDSPAK